MSRVDTQAHWIASANIAKFQDQLKIEKDTCQRKLLEGFVVMEQQKLKKMAAAR